MKAFWGDREDVSAFFFGGGQGFLIPGRFVGKFLTQSGGGGRWWYTFLAHR